MNKLILDCTAERYHADNFLATPTLSSSIASAMVNECPAIARHRHPKLGGARQEPTDATERGSIIHEMLLGAGKGMAVVDATAWRTKAARAARDQARAQGLVPVLAHKKRELDYAVECIRIEMERLCIGLTGEAEAVALWEETADDGTPVQCRGMFDMVWQRAFRLLDLKTCASAHPRKIQRSILDYGYDVQRAAYTSAVRALWPESAGRESMLFLFFECDDPFICTPVELDGSFRELGERKWRRAVNLWAECLRTDHWPGYVSGTLQVSAPTWAIEEDP